MTDRLGSACWVLLCVLLAVGHGAERKTPTLTWNGSWEKTNLHQSYHSFVKLAEGRIASFVNEGLPGSDCNCPGVEFPGGVVVSFTREPGNLLTWTTSAPLMTWGMIEDLPDLADPKKAAPKRLMTRPTVARLSDGEFWGLGAISRDHPAVDGLWYIASFAGSAERVNMLKAALLAGRSAPRSAMWKYRGKVTGPLGDYQDKLQVPNAMSTGVGSLIHLPDGPPAPDHVRVTRNRFLLFADAVGSPDLKNNGWVWTSLCYSADGREWFFAKDATGAVRNVTPYRDAKKEDHMFPFVLRRAADEWWMWRSAGFQGKENEDKSGGVTRSSCITLPTA